MKSLKCYVGLNNRFVVCERFPDDEEHTGLNILLDDFIDDNNIIEDVLGDGVLPVGFYSISFALEKEAVRTFDGEDWDEFLVIEEIEPL